MRLFEIKNKKPFRLSLGDRGEMIAWRYLVSQGYRILKKNYKISLGEIDVIAEREDRLAFVEIKTRTSNYFGLPEEAVDEVKQRKIIRVAKCYLKEKNKENSKVSFDVLSIIWRLDKDPEFKLIQDAFIA